MVWFPRARSLDAYSQALLLKSRAVPPRAYPVLGGRMAQESLFPPNMTWEDVPGTDGLLGASTRHQPCARTTFGGKVAHV